jgi:molybdopterin/thiamine biosynthesis adenylyltransferase
VRPSAGRASVQQGRPALGGRAGAARRQAVDPRRLLRQIDFVEAEIGQLKAEIARQVLA